MAATAGCLAVNWGPLIAGISFGGLVARLAFEIEDNCGAILALALHQNQIVRPIDQLAISGPHQR